MKKRNPAKKIPSKAKVMAEIKQALRRRLKVDTQEELARLALRQLRKEDKAYSLSATRAKRSALQLKEVEVKAKTRKMPRMRKITKCPICGSKIVPLKVKNLLNKLITIGYRCTACAYESDLEAFIPMKYAFVWKEAKI